MERYDKAAPPELGQNEGSLTSTLRTLLFFTALMILLPIGLYFSSKAYVFEAWNEGSRQWREGKQD
ncbi:unnamed protein product [Caretta caretta]